MSRTSAATGRGVDRRVRGGSVHFPSDVHSGSAPRDLGDRIQVPGLVPFPDFALTRLQYYRFRYNEDPPR